MLTWKRIAGSICCSILLCTGVFGATNITPAKNQANSKANITFHLVDTSMGEKAGMNGSVKSDLIPAGSKLFYRQNGKPILLKTQPILPANSITSAGPIIELRGIYGVTINLLPGESQKLRKFTMKNIGEKIAIVNTKNGKSTVINVANIGANLQSPFTIEGLTFTEAENLKSLIN